MGAGHYQDKSQLALVNGAVEMTHAALGTDTRYLKNGMTQLAGKGLISTISIFIIIKLLKGTAHIFMFNHTDYFPECNLFSIAILAL